MFGIQTYTSTKEYINIATVKIHNYNNKKDKMINRKTEERDNNKQKDRRKDKKDS
jgi:hypothetical protein